MWQLAHWRRQPNLLAMVLCLCLVRAQLLQPGITTPRAYANAAGQASGQERNIDRILEVLPEYGQGFLAACLADSSNDAEAVIHQLLEGTLPKHLSKMDPHLTAWQPRKAPAPQPGPSTSSAAGADLLQVQALLVA